MDPARPRTVNNLATHRGAASAGEGQALDTATAAMVNPLLWTDAPRLFLQHGEIDQTLKKYRYPGQGTLKFFALLVVATLSNGKHQEQTTKK